MALDMKTFPVRKRLPVKYCTEIGRIITRWPLVEYTLQEITYQLLGLGPKEGRLAVREPRVEDHLTMILDLMKLYGLTTSINIKNFRAILNECERGRDMLAHGIWLQHSGTGTPVIREIRGKYPPSPGSKSVKARVNPRSMVMEFNELKKFTRNVQFCVVQLHKLRHEILEQQSERRAEFPQRPDRGP